MTNSKVVRSRLKRFSMWEVALIAPLLVFVVAAGEQFAVNIPRMRWAQWARLPWHFKVPLIVMGVLTIVMLFHGKFRIGQSAFVVDRKQRPFLFWTFFVCWSICMAFVTQAFLLFA